MATSGGSGAAWTELGPHPEVLPGYGNVSGRVTALTTDLVNDPSGNTVYVGTAFGGVWKSTNALAASPTFTPISDQTMSLSVGSIALDSSTNPATIYVGTGEANGSADSYYGIGILKSSNGGQSWTLSSSADSGAHPFSGLAFSKILIDPVNSRHIVAAATSASAASGLSITRGIYASTDGGQSWSLVFGNGYSITDLAYDSQNHVYYAAVRDSGIYSSSDGKTWTACASPFAGQPAVTSSNFYRAALAARSGIVYALIAGSNGNLSQPSLSDTGIVQSADGGQTWTAIAAPPSPADFFGSNGQGFYDIYVAVPAGSTHLIIAGIDVWSAPAVAGSSTVWTNLTNSYAGGNVHPDQHAIAVAGPATWVIGNDGGVWATANGGTSWQNLNATMGNIQFTSVTPDMSTPGIVFGGAQDNGTSVNTANSLTWNEILAGDGGFTGADPDNTNIYYSENFGISLQRSSGNGPMIDTPVVDTNLIADQAGFYPPFEVMPAHPSQILMGTCRVWKGPGQPAITDANWTPISGDLTGSGASNCSSQLGNISSIASAPGDGRVIYAVTDNGRVQVTTNADAATPAWTDVTAAPLPTDGNRPFSTVAVSPADPNTVYVGVMGFGTGHVFKSTNAGQSWTDITGSLPDAPVNSILIDPENTNDIYLGSDVGVFAATDGGVSGEAWQRMGTGLPDTTVVQLKLSQTGTRALIAATHGRGAWSIAPLTNNPDFALHLAADGQTLAAPGNATLMASLSAINGYAGTVSLSCTAPTTGCTISPASIQPGQSATITVASSALASADTVVTIHATDGAISHDRNADVQLTLLSVSPSALQVSPGQSTTTVVSAQNLTGTATLSCPDAPAGITCRFAPSTIDPINNQTNVSVNAANSAASGDFTFHIAITVGGQTLTTPVTLHVLGFTLTAPNGAAATVEGASGTATFAIAFQPAQGVSPTVALRCSNTGTATCSFNPASITTGQTSTLTVSNLSGISNGQLQFNVVGTSGSETESEALSVQVQDFTLTSNATSNLVSGDTATFTLNATGSNGYNQPLTYSCSGLSTGVCSFSPNPATPGQAVTLTLSGLSKLTGSLSFQVSATDGRLTHSLPLTVSASDFTLGTMPPASILAGTGTASFTVTPAAVNGFTGSINLTCGAIAGAPAAACAFNPATVTAGQSSALTISGLKAVAAQNLTVAVIGTSGALTHSVSATIRVQDYTVKAATSSASVATGTDITTFAIQTAAVNGYSGTIALSCSGLDAKAACSFSPASVTPGQSSTLTVSGLNQEAAAGKDSLSFQTTGASNGGSHAVALQIKISDIGTGSGTGGSGWSTPSASVTAGNTAQVTLGYASVNGFSGQVTMSCSALPAKATCNFTPSSFTLTAGGQQNVTLAITTTAHSLLPPAPPTSTPGSREMLLLALGLAGLIALGLTSRRRQRLVFAGATLLLGALLLAGCGGGGGSTGGSSGTPTAQTGTPAGTYTVNAIATANGVSHITPVTLSVQ